MILGLIYTGAGIFILLVAAGLVQRQWLPDPASGSRTVVRLAMTLFGIGMILLGLYYGWIYFNRLQARNQSPASRLEKDVRPGSTLSSNRPDPQQWLSARSDRGEPGLLP